MFLPTDILHFHIFPILDIKSLYKSKGVCRQWRDIIILNDELWIQHLKKAKILSWFKTGKHPLLQPLHKKLYRIYRSYIFTRNTLNETDEKLIECAQFIHKCDKQVTLIDLTGKNIGIFLTKLTTRNLITIPELKVKVHYMNASSHFYSRTPVNADNMPLTEKFLKRLTKHGFKVIGEEELKTYKHVRELHLNFEQSSIAFVTDGHTHERRYPPELVNDKRISFKPHIVYIVIQKSFIREAGSSVDQQKELDSKYNRIYRESELFPDIKFIVVLT